MSLPQEGEPARHGEVIEPQIGPSEVITPRPLCRRHDGEETGLLCGSQADGGIFEGDTGPGSHVEACEGVVVNVRSRLFPPDDIARRDHIKQRARVGTARRVYETVDVRCCRGGRNGELSRASFSSHTIPSRNSTPDSRRDR
jgi:hypothetical protein